VAAAEIGILDILRAAATLKRLPRTGWLLAGVAAPESVADHNWATALLAMLLAEAVNRDPAAEGLDTPLDMARLLQIALVHDLAEAEVTDLPRRTTLLLGKPAKLQAEAAALAQLTARLSGGEALVARWEEYSAASSPEARLVIDADKLELVHQALTYTRFGARGLEEFWHGHRWHFHVCERIFVSMVAAQSATGQA
jgi:putative hydrolase of HD superfamily